MLSLHCQMKSLSSKLNGDQGLSHSKNNKKHHKRIMYFILSLLMSHNSYFRLKKSNMYACYS